MQIITDDLSGTEIRALLEEHFDAMLSNSPPGSCHFLDFDGLRAGNVAFWSIWDGNALAGCGALKEITPDHGEIKSMRTHRDHLRKGVASRMLDHIIATAKDRGYERLSLETGSAPAFEPALFLYRDYAFIECPPFADYKPDPFSIFMTRKI